MSLDGAAFRIPNYRRGLLICIKTTLEKTNDRDKVLDE